ncbi:MAG: hypothetical protein AAF990_15440 [Bacteroidota bacterium]
MNQQIKAYLSSKDDILQPILAKLSWKPVKSTNNVFHDLMSCIIEQQIHYRSSKKKFAKLLAAAALEELTPESFEVFEQAALPSVKLSARKYETMARTLDFFQNKQTDWQAMENDEVRNILSNIKGIGPWTIDMILMYTLERPDILPKGDHHLKGIIAKLYELDPSRTVASEIQRIGKNWSPYASTAVQCLWAWQKSSSLRD